MLLEKKKKKEEGYEGWSEREIERSRKRENLWEKLAVIREILTRKF